MVTGHVEHLDPAILLGVPLELVVTPVLLHPQVGRHDLVLQILKIKFCILCLWIQRGGEDTFIKAEIIIMIDDEVFWHANRRKKMIGKLAPPPTWPLENKEGKVSLLND